MTNPPIPLPNPIIHYIDIAYPIHNNTPKGKTLLAEAAEVTWATVHKASLGLYSSIPIKLVNYMAANPVGDADHSATRWNELYTDFIRSEMNILKYDIYAGRIECAALFMNPGNLKKHFNSFITWRESMSYSQMDFCKTFLIHQGILNKYEQGQMKNLPETVKERLRYLGMTESYINSVGALPVPKRDSK